MRAAVDHLRKLLVPAVRRESNVFVIGPMLSLQPEGTDELKRKQLMELAIINGTYRPFHAKGEGERERQRQR